LAIFWFFAEHWDDYILFEKLEIMPF
jgi:hypothetical protein